MQGQSDRPQSSENATQPIADLISSLSQIEAYDDAAVIAGPVSVLQTHISVLFFVGEPFTGRVYKVKKPVNLGFLDYTSLEARKHFCQEEVRLNRRLAPEVYLGVRSIVRRADGAMRIGTGNEPDSEIIDYAVEMVQLPAASMLSARLDCGEIDNDSLQRVIDLLAKFHRECPTGVGIDEHATPPALRRQVGETLERLRAFIGRLWSQQLVDGLADWIERFFCDHQQLLKLRIDEGRIREGHGDLHSENICIMDDRIAVYDCIEFTRQFRCRDVACEIAFLAMDLDARGYRGFGRFFVHQYATLTADDDFHRVLPLYKIYLALVRAKVTALKSVDHEVCASDQREAAAKATRYALLAGSYVVGTALVIMCGLPASGKSWAARAIAQPFEALVLRSDVIRKRLAGLQATENASLRSPEVYAAAFTQQTYEAMLLQAHEALASGRTVVADATFADPALRHKFITLATELHVPWIVVHASAPEEEIHRRMQQRSLDRSEVSDADWSVYLATRERWHDPVEIAGDHLVSIVPEMTASDAAAIAIDSLITQVRK